MLPTVSTAAMSRFLAKLFAQVVPDAHAVLLLDQTGWHGARTLVVPPNLTLVPLPPYSPELNPVERIWHYRRSHWLANAIFRDLKHIMDPWEIAWQRFGPTTV